MQEHIKIAWEETNMEYYLTLNNETIGPFKKEDIIEKLKLGEISYDTYCWKEGWDEWKLIQTIFPPQLPKVENVIAENSANTIEQDYVSSEESHSVDENESISQKTKNHTNRQDGQEDGRPLNHPFQPPPPPQKNRSIKIAATITLIFLAIYTSYLFLHNNKSQETTIKNTPSPVVNTQEPLSWDQTVKSVSSAIQKGDPRAMAIMSYWMTLGLLKNDKSEALKLAQQSMDLGCPLGGFALAGIDYIKSPNSNKYELAYPKILELAEKGDAFAQYAIACYYAFGFGGLEKNNDLHIEWLKKAISQNQLEAMDLGGLLLAKRFGQPQQAFNLYLSAANRGFPHAMWILGISYCEGTGIILPKNETLPWLSKAADANYGPALFYLACSNRENPEKMLSYLKRGSDVNDPQALCKLGDMFLDGKLVEHNPDKGCNLIQQGLDSQTLNNTHQGSVEAYQIESYRSRVADIRSRKAESLEKIEKEIEHKNKISKEFDSLLEIKSEIRKEMGENQRFIYNRGKDDAYEIIKPRLIMTHDYLLHPEALNGTVMRFWRNKNLACKLEYQTNLGSRGGPAGLGVTEVNTFYTMHIYYGDTDSEDISKNGFDFYQKLKKREFEPLLSYIGNISFIGFTDKPATYLGFINRLEADDEYFEGPDYFRNKIYPIFKKWEQNFIDAKENYSAEKKISGPWYFVWNSNGAKLQKRAPHDFSHGSANIDSIFIENIFYCLDQIPEMKNLLHGELKKIAESENDRRKREKELTK